jgi:hypothetical protein
MIRSSLRRGVRPTVDYRQVVEAGLKGGAFSKRRWSWVAEVDNLFLKIPGNAASARAAALSPQALEEAKLEESALAVLAEASPAVVAPLQVVESPACLVFPLIRGPDLRMVLLNEGDSEDARGLLRQALLVAGAFHAATPPRSLPERDYARSATRRVLVVEGYEVRNFRIDSAGELRFFDPHDLALGFREEDLTRFILSLLMLEWGRNLRAFPWTKFDVRFLLTVFEEISGEALGDQRVKECFDYNCAARYQRADILIDMMPRYLRPLAKFYKRVFFWQTGKWRVAHGL